MLICNNYIFKVFVCSTLLQIYNRIIIKKSGVMSSILKEHFQGVDKETQKTEEEKELQSMTPNTQICIHKGQQEIPLDPDYLVNIFPEKLNQLTISPETIFKFHFLSKSLYYWVEMVQKQSPSEDKLSKKNSNLIKEILRKQDNLIFSRWQPLLQDQTQYIKHKEQQQNFVAPGQSKRFFTKGQKKFEIAYINGGDKKLTSYRQRFELLLIMYIDGASYIDNEDSTWGYYFVYEIDEKDQRHFAGLLSKYSFKITSKRLRERISQVFILPCYQKIGLAKQLLDQFYTDCLQKVECFEITVEGPSTEFQCLRNFKQAEMIIKSKIFDTQAIKNYPLKTSDNIRHLRSLYLSDQNIKEIKSKFKLPGQQIDAIVSILIYGRVLSSSQQLLRAIFQDLFRQKLIMQLAAFRDRQIVPSLFIQNEPVDVKNYLIIKTKQQFMLRNNSGLEDTLTENLEGFRRVIQKLQKQGLLKKQ